MARRGRSKRERPAPPTAAYRQLVNPFEPNRVLSDDHVAHLHTSALEYLRDEGIRVLFDEARLIFTEAGARVDEDEMMVRLDPEMVEAALASAPSEFTIHAPNPERDVRVGGRNIALLPVGGPPFVSDLDHGRRAGTFEDFENFTKLIQSFDVMAATAPSIEATDVEINTRHLSTNQATLELSDKVPFLFARGRQRVRDGFDIIQLRYEMDDDTFASRAVCWSNINTNSPRQLDVPMAMGIIDFARAGQAMIMTPFTLAGAMAPVSMAGALVLQHMESVAAITLSQLVRPGAPVVYGAFTSNVDMKSGSPAFGTPEALKGAIASGQLARYIGVPWRSSGSSASNAVDAQGGYETMMNTFGAVMGGANWIMHAAGWQEGGLTASYEKFITDIEMCQMLAESFSPIKVDDAELALDAITEVGPGGHFFGVQHTLDRYETAFYQPIVFSRDNYEQWTEEGAPLTDQRANAIWKKTLTDFEPPPLDDGTRAAMADFVQRRTAEGGAPPD